MVGNNRNTLVERVLPGSILRKLTDEEMTESRRPSLDPADRWPTLTWPREVPIRRRTGERGDLGRTLGALSQDAMRRWCRLPASITEASVSIGQIEQPPYQKRLAVRR
jgi:hypothetical protein